MTAVTITAIAEAEPRPGDSLETLVFRGARAALDEAGIDRGDLDGVVLAASDQTDGRAISSMLTSGPAGAYLNDEINVASSPGHALALAYMQIRSGTHRRLLVSSWGKASESPRGREPAERLSAEPFYERDAGISALAAAAFQALCHRNLDERRGAAAAQVAARNQGLSDPAAVEASEMLATPLRALEVPSAIDASYSIVLQRGSDAAGPAIAGIGWCSDSARVADRDLVGLPHLALAARDAYRSAGVQASAIGSFHLHDYTPDAEILSYAPLGICSQGEELALAFEGAPSGRINPEGGSVRGEAPFGGPLRKVLEAVRRLRSGDVEHVVAQMTTGFAGQFQTVAILGQAG